MLRSRAGRWELFFLIVSLCGMAAVFLGLQFSPPESSSAEGLRRFRWLAVTTAVAFVAWACMLFVAWGRSDARGMKRWAWFAALVVYSLALLVVFYEAWRMIG
jgi:lysylphosphatidylglycerol synthetase-like protein (DUF2156 family)